MRRRRQLRNSPLVATKPATITSPPTIRTGHANPLSSTVVEVVVSKLANIPTFSRLRPDSCGLVKENFDTNGVAALRVLLALQRTEVGDGLASTGINAFERLQNGDEVPVALLSKISDRAACCLHVRLLGNRVNQFVGQLRCVH